MLISGEECDNWSIMTIKFLDFGVPGFESSFQSNLMNYSDGTSRCPFFTTKGIFIYCPLHLSQFTVQKVKGEGSLIQNSF